MLRLVGVSSPRSVYRARERCWKEGGSPSVPYKKGRERG